MTDQTQEHSGDLSRAYDQMIKHGIAAIETGWEQTTAAAKLFAASSRTEMDEAGKTWGVAVNAARDRNEKITDLLKDPATFSPPGGTGLRSETKELVDQMIEGAKSFSQSWTGHLTGLEQRQADFIKGMSMGNSKIIESSQDLAKSAVAYGESVLASSQGAAKPVAPQDES